MSDNTINDGGPAYPSITRRLPGMSLRDWFAGQALAGITARPCEYAYTGYVAAEWDAKGGIDAWRKMLHEEDAAYAYRAADAMIAARNR